MNKCPLHDEVITHINRKLDRLLDAVIGDSSEAKPGLVVRIDRVEQTTKNWRRVSIGILIAVVSALILRYV